MKARLAATATAEVNEAVQYLKERNLAAAVRLSTAIKAAVARLEAHPFSGPVTTDRKMRVTGVSKFGYRIFYTVEGEQLLIHYFRHGARRPLDSLENE